MRLSWLILLLLVFGGRQAHGEEMTSPAPQESPAPLLVLSGPWQISQPLAAALHELVRRDGGALVDLRNAAPVAPSSAAELARAVAAYQDFDYGRAMGHLTKALSEAEQEGAAGLTSAELSDLYIYRAMVRHGQGNATAAWEDFIRAATVDPARHLDAVRFSPSNVASFERARTKVSESDFAKLMVEADAGCELYIDGRKENLGLEISLAQGAHLLRLDCPGKPRHSQRLSLAGGLRKLLITVEAAKPPTRQQVLKFADEREFDHLVWVHVITGSGASPTAIAELIRRDGTQVARTSITVDGTQTTKRTTVLAISKLLDSLKPVIPNIVRTTKPTPWYRKPWLWATVGAVAATTALLPLLLRKDEPSGFGLSLGGDTP